MRVQCSPQLITLEEAIDRTINSPRHLLLGNGFSINANSSFKYRSLFESAQPLSLGVEEIFHRLETEDFERVLEEIRQLGSQTQNGQYELYEKEVREAFLSALSSVHPHNSGAISRDEIDKCAAFLEYFVGLKRPLMLRGRVYTTNYDLLLYWVVVRSERKLWCYDNHEGQPYGTWNSKKNPSLVYLHGALHLYDTSVGQIMLRYDGERSIIKQTRKRLEEERFPVIVAEGTSEAKAARIQRSKYLRKMGEHFRKGFQDANAVLFTYGHSLSDRDAHLLNIIGEAKIKAVYIGAYKGLNGADSESIRNWTTRWNETRLNRNNTPPEVWVYDTSMFSPWR